MKRNVYKRTGYLSPLKITRKQAATYLREWRKAAKIKIAVWTDAKGYQSTCEFNPYVLYVVCPSSTVFKGIGESI